MARHSPVLPPKLKAKLQAQHEEVSLNKLREKYGPKVDRVCQRSLCCQAITKDGRQCSRKAVYPDLTFDRAVGCCSYCWQHLTLYGLNKHVTPERVRRVMMNLILLGVDQETREAVKLEMLSSGLR